MSSCTFNETKRLVRMLVEAKGFPNDGSALTQKLLRAFVELSEAADTYKKGEDWGVVSEELIDALVSSFGIGGFKYLFNSLMEEEVAKKFGKLVSSGILRVRLRGYVGS